jgi:hypothetical protein
LVVVACAAVAASASSAPAASLLVTGPDENGMGVILEIGADGAPSGEPRTTEYQDHLGPALRYPLFAPDGRRAWFSTFNTIRALSILGDHRFQTGDSDVRLTPGITATSPDGRFGFGRDEGDIIAMRLDPEGFGTVTGRVPVLGTEPVASPDGRFLFVGQDNGPDDQPMATLAVGADGSLTSTGHQAVGPGAEILAVAPDGGTVYATSGYEALTWTSVGPDGALTRHEPVPTPIHENGRAIVVAPDGRHVYTADSSGVITYRVLPGGRPEYVGLSPAPRGRNADSLAISPDGRHIYTTYWSESAVTTYDVGSDGMPVARPVVAPFLTFQNTPYFALAVTPDQAPVAAFTSTPAAAGSESVFDGSGSADPDGRVARYDWDFGDGTTSSTTDARVAHRFAQPGRYAVRLTVTDAAGTSTDRVFTGRQVVRNGGASATTAAQVDVSSAPVSTGTPLPPGMSPAPTPGPGTVLGLNPGTTIRPDAGRVTAVDLTRSALRFRVRDAVRVRVDVRRRVVSRGRTVWRPIALRTLRADPARVNRLQLRLRLRPGVYRTDFRATRTDGRVRSARVTRRVR